MSPHSASSTGCCEACFNSAPNVATLIIPNRMHNAIQSHTIQSVRSYHENENTQMYTTKKTTNIYMYSQSQEHIHAQD